MHKIQKELLKRTVQNPNQRFSELTRGYDYEDNVVFHLKQLIKLKLINKTDNSYRATRLGVKESVKFDFDTLEEKDFKVLFASFICIHKDKRLLHEHKSDTYTFYKFPGRKPFAGEPMDEALQRIFEADVVKDLPDKVQFEFQGIHFVTHLTSKKNLLFDEIVAYYKVELSQSKIENIKPAKRNKWFTKSEVKKLENKYPEIDIWLFEKNPQRHRQYSFTNDYSINDSTW